MDREYLYEEYVVKERGMEDIAQENNTYKSKVRRLLQKYGYAIRTKSEAQKASLKHGRRPHPTFGTKRSTETKDKIGDSMSASWNSLTPEAREKRIAFYKQQWQLMTLEEQLAFRERAAKAIRLAARYGSKLEKFLVAGLRVAGYNVVFHNEKILEREELQIDILLPDNNVAIEVDGPSHFLPIWGEEKLQKNIERDNTKNGLLMQHGYTVFRVKYLSKNVSKKRMRELLEKLLDALKSVSGEPQLIELGA